MRKNRNRNRKPRSQQTNPPAKRRKIGDKTSSGVYAGWTTRTETQETDSDKPPTEKRKQECKTNQPAPKRKKITSLDIRSFFEHPKHHQISQQLPFPTLGLVIDEEDHTEPVIAPTHKHLLLIMKMTRQR